MKITHELTWTPAQLSGMIPLKRVDFFVVHHTVSPPDTTIEQVDSWHKSKGWIGAGYHFLIKGDGSIERGRPENMQGAHTIGYNDRSLGIALAGDFSKTPPTEAQITSLTGLLLELRQKYHKATIAAHRHLQATECPGKLFPWDELLKRLEANKMPETPDIRAVKIEVNGKEIPGVLLGDYTFAPVRALAEALGKTVEWDEKNGKVVIK
jgi:N-acetyl-anhydromuramyl-L-alanine amidase AmpD